MSDRPHYPWSEGDELFAAELNAAIANSVALAGGMLPLNGSAPMTGPLTLAGNAVQPLQAVPLQQLTAATAGAPFLPLSGGTVSGPVTFNATVGVNATVQANVFFTGQNTWSPASAALQPIIDSRANLAGVVSGTSELQRIIVSSDTMDARLGDNACYSDLGIYHNVGGATVNGGRQTIWSQLNVGTLSVPSLQMNGIQSSIFVTGNTNGAFCQPIASSVLVQNGGSTGGTGNEFIVTAPAGSSPNDKYFLQLTYGHGDAVAGSGGSADGNVMLRFANSNASGAPGAGMLLGLGNQGQGFPVNSGGSILGTTVQIANQGLGRNIHFIAPQCANGIDFRQVNFTASAFRSPGFSVDGAGGVHVGNALLAPTAAGLALTVPNQTVTAAAVAAGGGGGGTGTNDYYVGDILFDANGGQYRVATIAAGAVATVTVLAGGVAASPPANPVATTGGSGINCTLNLTWSANNQLTLSPAGTTWIDNPATGTTNVDMLTLSRNGTRMLHVSTVSNNTGVMFLTDAQDMQMRPTGQFQVYGSTGAAALVVLNQASPAAYIQLGSFASGGAYVAAIGGGAPPLVLQGSANGGVSINDHVGFQGTAPIAQPTGWGTSTGGARGPITASSTLAQVAAGLSQLLTDLKSYGLLGT